MKHYAPLDQIAKKCGQGVFQPITHGPRHVVLTLVLTIQFSRSESALLQDGASVIVRPFEVDLTGSLALTIVVLEAVAR